VKQAEPGRHEHLGYSDEMLPVSDLLEVARHSVSGAEVSARAPARFAPPGDAPFVVVWNVGIHCNMSCPHCYAAATARPSPHDLDTDEGLRLLDELARAGVRVLIVSGGEPLLRPDVFSLLARAREVGLAAQLSTNGVLIDEPVASRLAACGVGYVGVSLDGLREWNDAYRGLPGGFDLAVRGLCFARAAGMRTGVRMTLTRRNVAELDGVAAVAVESGAERFYVSHLVDSGRGARLVFDDLDRGEARETLEHLFETAERWLERGCATRVVTGSNDSDGPFLLRWIESRYGGAAAAPVEELLLARGGNSAGERILAVDHRGRVHPDQFWRAAVLGDVRTTPFAEILKHPLRAELRDRLAHLTGRCGVCSYRALCRGSHRERAIARNGELWSPDPACVLEDLEIGIEDATARAARG
jgi:radical SAM protein with 4Fe4S-binding SPASM domain